MRAAFVWRATAHDATAPLQSVVAGADTSVPIDEKHGARNVAHDDCMQLLELALLLELDAWQHIDC